MLFALPSLTLSFPAFIETRCDPALQENLCYVKHEACRNATLSSLSVYLQYASC